MYYNGVKFSSCRPGCGTPVQPTLPKSTIGIVSFDPKSTSAPRAWLHHAAKVIAMAKKKVHVYQISHVMKNQGTWIGNDVHGQSYSLSHSFVEKEFSRNFHQKIVNSRQKKYSFLRAHPKTIHHPLLHLMVSRSYCSKVPLVI